MYQTDLDAVKMAGKTIVLTGATGFVGMAVLERVFRDHYDTVEHVYCLIRSSKGESAEVRLEHALANPIFDSLRKVHPEFADKVSALEGDLSAPGLGICEHFAESTLGNTVETIIHCAASIEFNLPLRDAFNINTMGTIHVLELADKCQKLKGIVHVSTAYVNCNKKDSLVIEEKIYPIAFGNPHYLVEHIPIVSQAEIDSLEKCVLNFYPNTYTFTKALTEHVLESKCDKWDIAIVRPSIITPALCTPIPGWTHGLAAAGGVVALIGMGVLDSMPARPEAVMDFVPVDFVASVIVAASNVAVGEPGLKVYHAASSCLKPLTWEVTVAGVLDGWKRQPDLQKKIFPVELQLIPDVAAHERRVAEVRQKKFFATAFKLAKKDPLSAGKILALVHRLDSTYLNFNFFASNEWIFEAKNVCELEKSVKAYSDNVTTQSIAEMDWMEYLFNFTVGIRRYVLEKNSSSYKDMPYTKPTAYAEAPKPAYQEAEPSTEAPREEYQDPNYENTPVEAAAKESTYAPASYQEPAYTKAPEASEEPKPAYQGSSCGKAPVNYAEAPKEAYQEPAYGKAPGSYQEPVYGKAPANYGEAPKETYQEPAYGKAPTSYQEPTYAKAPAGYAEAPRGSYQEPAYAKAPAGYAEAPKGYQEPAYAKAPAGYGEAPRGSYQEPTYAKAPAGYGEAPKASYQEPAYAKAPVGYGEAPRGSYQEPAYAKAPAGYGEAPKASYQEPAYAKAPVGYGEAPRGSYQEPAYAKAPAGYAEAPKGYQEPTYAKAPAGYGEAPKGYQEPAYAKAPAGYAEAPKGYQEPAYAKAPAGYGEAPRGSYQEPAYAKAPAGYAEAPKASYQEPAYAKAPANYAEAPKASYQEPAYAKAPSNYAEAPKASYQEPAYAKAPANYAEAPKPTYTKPAANYNAAPNASYK
ncbi:hypothetical protein DSO57_1038156 [Entomophthora muscae]|uniref:Uncharacterized protein n=1 Tax=Entomophthora muscae TaxID=34485 RepID=A0ACC2U7T1_9FUNG|nr:hypothetical protein DSO57_1038156 [Entomophthora muscae]